MKGIQDVRKTIWSENAGELKHMVMIQMVIEETEPQQKLDHIVL